MRTYLILALALMSVCHVIVAQSLAAQEVAASTGFDKVLVLSFPGKLSRKLDEKQLAIEAKLERQTEKYLRKIQQQEIKLLNKLQHDRLLQQAEESVISSISLGSDSLFNSWKQTLSNDPIVNAALPKLYSGRIDSMTTALNFLQQDGKIVGLRGSQIEKLKSQYNEIYNQLNKAEHLKQLIQERKTLLKEKFANLMPGAALSKFQKQTIYFQKHLEEFQQAIQDPNLIEKKLLESLSYIPSFRKFFDKYSVLGSMFRLPGQVDDMSPAALLNGLQTRDALLKNIIQHMGSTKAAHQAMSFGMKEGREAMESLIGQLEKALQNGEFSEIPGYKPTDQKSKPFFKRFELGTNLQSSRANNFYPTTMDLGLSLGYKINPKAIVGAGVSYKAGLGQNINHIKITHQGMGIRTFLDMKINKNFWLTGGSEWNYHEPFGNLTSLKTVNQWQQSLMFGIQKKQTLGKYKSTISLLYDAFWQRQIPRGQPLLIRVGYTFR